MDIVQNELDSHPSDEIQLKIYQRELNLELKREIQFEKAQAEELFVQRNYPKLSKLKIILKRVKNSFIYIGSILGWADTGFDTAMLGAGVPPETSILQKSTGALLALASSAAYSIEDIYDTWNDDRLKQRKTRYGANLLTIGLFGLGIAATVGAISFLTAPIALPLIMLGVLGIGVYKHSYIFKRTSTEIEILKNSFDDKLQEIDQRIDQLENEGHIISEANLFTAVRHDFKIQRLACQLHDIRKQHERLIWQKLHAKTHLKNSAGLLVGLGVLLGAIVFPPLNLLFLLAGGVIFLTAVYHRAVSLPSINYLVQEQRINKNRDMSEIDNFISRKIISKYPLHQPDNSMLLAARMLGERNEKPVEVLLNAGINNNNESKPAAVAQASQSLLPTVKTPREAAANIRP